MTAASLTYDRMPAAVAYDGKADVYFAGARHDLVAALPADPSAKILEIGCGSGETGAIALRSGKAARYVGVDISERAAERARAVLSQVLVGNIERMSLPFEPGSFDALILSEVLEHLIEPWTALRRLAGLVRPGGMVLASSPNVAHYHVIVSLLKGRFELADSGTFDRTHMRWFTPSSFVRMFEEAGFAVTRLAPVTPFASRTRLISQLSGGRLDHLFMRQIAVHGIKR